MPLRRGQRFTRSLIKSGRDYSGLGSSWDIPRAVTGAREEESGFYDLSPPTTKPPCNKLPISSFCKCKVTSGHVPRVTGV